MTIFIRRSKDPFGWMGNMSAYPIQFEGLTFKTAEHLFQALRFDGKPNIQALIRGEPNPFQAKLVAKKWAKEMTVPQRSELDLINMRLVLKLKLQQHPDLAELLISTGTIEIKEDCSKRATESGLFWGVDDKDNGFNWLGRLWMEQRDLLLKERNK